MVELILIGFVMIMLVFSIRKAKAEKEIKKAAKQELINKQKELNAKECLRIAHTVGLPLSEGVICEVYLCEDKIIIDGNNVVFNLSKDKIIDISIKTNTEIQKSYVSSSGGAIAGGVVFGPLGALIGGRAKEKKSTIIKNYLIFTYEKEENIEYIAFDITGVNGANKFIDDFRVVSSNRTNKIVEL